MPAPLVEPPCSLSFDDGRVIRCVSEAGARLLGRPRAELVGQPLNLVLPLASRIFFDMHLLPVLALKGQTDAMFLSLLRADGRPVPVLLTARRDLRGGGVRTDCGFLEVRRRDLLERELAWAKREIEQAASAR
ncbi:MAG TPA: PAS domain-containing protein [Polyangiaceae bacterium]|nr:PAS domain-containing protein [Polyangiaceae bacterium]